MDGFCVHHLDLCRYCGSLPHQRSAHADPRLPFSIPSDRLWLRDVCARAHQQVDLWCLEETLRESDFVFVFATATADSHHLLSAEKLDLLKHGARLILVSRAAVVGYEALLERLRQGKLHAAIDVWPTEPIPSDDPFLGLKNVVVSAHRAGGIPQAFFTIGEMVCDDLELLRDGLPPARMQVAAPELVTRYRNKPVG